MERIHFLNIYISQPQIHSEGLTEYRLKVGLIQILGIEEKRETLFL